MSAVMSEVTPTPVPTKQPNPAITFRLKDCAVMVELEARPTDRVPRLSAYAHLKPRKRRFQSYQPRIRVSFSVADLSECYLNRRGYEDSLWISCTCFDIDARDADKVAEFLTGVGVKITDERTPGGSR